MGIATEAPEAKQCVSPRQGGQQKVNRAIAAVTPEAKKCVSLRQGGQQKVNRAAAAEPDTAASPGA